MSTTLQLVGATAITVGVVFLSIPIGIIVGGCFLVLIGFSLGR
jgi:hypothetical protein